MHEEGYCVCTCVYIYIWYPAPPPPPRDLPFLKLVLLRLVSWGGGEIKKIYNINEAPGGGNFKCPLGPKFSKYKWCPCTLSPGAPGGHFKVF